MATYCPQCYANLVVGQQHACNPYNPYYADMFGQKMMSDHDARDYLTKAVKEAQEAAEREKLRKAWTLEVSMTMDDWQDIMAEHLQDAHAEGVEMEVEQQPHRMVAVARPKLAKGTVDVPKTKVPFNVDVDRAPDKPHSTVDIGWMEAAVKKARESVAFIKLEIETKGITVIGQEDDRIFTHTITWQALDKAKINPLLIAIQHVETELEK